MIKTETEISRDFYMFVKNSELGRAIKGTVCREGQRVDNADTEDLVVSFLSGVDGQVQKGVVVLNLYVPDIPDARNGRKTINYPRIGELERLILDFIRDGGGSEYELMSDGSPKAKEDRDIHQHFIYTRIKFKRLALWQKTK